MTIRRSSASGEMPTWQSLVVSTTGAGATSVTATIAVGLPAATWSRTIEGVGKASRRTSELASYRSFSAITGTGIIGGGHSTTRGRAGSSTITPIISHIGGHGPMFRRSIGTEIRRTCPCSGSAARLARKLNECPFAIAARRRSIAIGATRSPGRSLTLSRGRPRRPLFGTGLKTTGMCSARSAGLLPPRHSQGRIAIARSVTLLRIPGARLRRVRMPHRRFRRASVETPTARETKGIKKTDKSTSPSRGRPLGKSGLR